MKRYWWTLLSIMSLSTIFLAFMLNIIRVDQYSSGSIMNDNEITYLVTNESKIYTNQAKQLRVENKNIEIIISQKMFQDNLYFYVIENMPFSVVSSECKIKMGNQSLGVFLFDKLINGT